MQEAERPLAAEEGDLSKSQKGPCPNKLRVER